ncbi:hypothetical protein AYI70_g9946, partial [Smittium culicis]
MGQCSSCSSRSQIRHSIPCGNMVFRSRDSRLASG